MARLFDEIKEPFSNLVADGIKESYSNLVAIPYEQYFGEMDLTDEQKENRINAARELEDTMIFVFALIATMLEYGKVNRLFIRQQLENRYLEIADKYLDVNDYAKYDDYIKRYAMTFAYNTIDTTLNRIEANAEQEYWLSDERAMLISENEANTLLNYGEFQDAIESGATHKKWVTMRDKKVRHTHREVDGETIEINEPFLVGDSYMMFPRDEESYGANPEEICNCRCTIQYY